MKKKLLHILLAIALIATLVPAAAAIEEANAPAVEYRTHVNPEYAHLDLDLPTAEEIPDSFLDNAVSTYSIFEAAAYVRSQMTQRIETITVQFPYVSNAWDKIIPLIFEHTGNPKEGDYLHTNYGGCGGTIRTTSSYVEIEFTVRYYTTADQEAQVDAKVVSLLSQWESEHNFSQCSDYEKVRIIYDYICDNVVYDYDNLNDSTYKLKYSTYAAMVLNKAVCQGYASMFYRLALESGLSARYISGKSSGGNHGWNIVELDGIYYNLDATWDAGTAFPYRYFLRSSNDFPDHTPNAEYLTAEFKAEYPVSETNYVFPREILASGTFGESITWSVDSRGKLSIGGFGAMPVVNASNQIPWYSYRTSVTEIEIGPGVTSLCLYAFLYCNAENIVLPNSVKWIRQYAFACSDTLTSITIPAGVEYLDRYAIYENPNLKDIYFGGSEEQWANISNGMNLTGITVHYNTPITSPSGLLSYGGTLYYFENGEVNYSYTGLASFEGNWYYVENGTPNYGFTDLVYHDGVYYYVENGVVNFEYTDLVIYAGAFFYVENGVLNWDYTGLVYYAGTFFYVEGGMLNWNYTGLAYYSGLYFYVENGMLNWNYTGLSYYGGIYFYVENGLLNWNYTGLAILNNNYFYIEGGMLNWNYTGIVSYCGVWFFVEGGMLTWTYNGTVAGPNGLPCRVIGSVLQM